jgi:mannose-6-phosphate isomerase-like protein (cupin superfamily)
MNSQQVRFLRMESVERQRAQQGDSYLEFLRYPSMSAGVYVLAVGSVDNQSPHLQDELYFVAEGRSRMRAGSEDQSVGPGSLIYIAAGVEHRFYDVEEELTVLVFFAPAESA